MKRIYFVRHAKSSWKNSSLSDIDRPLNDRGRRDGPIMAKKLAEKISDVDLAICSPARRARATFKYFSKRIKCKEVVINDDVYHAWTDTLVSIVQNIPNEVDVAMIFGHNPGFTYMYNQYSRNTLDNLPTCGIFELIIDGKWVEMGSKNTDTGLLIYPKKFING